MRRPSESKIVRCAIYTRKSDERGLEQEFNSLDAQREACDAFIASQRHEGWKRTPNVYDDGGLSGGTMDRPALQRLLSDVRAGKVDCIVVYKIDRLTRSLADFARIVEVLDANGASFVSVTQAFNTTTSMGRLTLNVLLSFAQFEREITGERIRDKIAASKARGLWMGGAVPHGYAVKERKLIVVPAEAANVRLIFERYVALGSVLALIADLEVRGIRTRKRVDRNGVARGDTPFARSALYRMLQNRLYIGEVCHKGEAYPGQHNGIVDPAGFEQVQTLLKRNRIDHADGVRATEPSLLIGKLWDAYGRRMSPDHCCKSGKRYRYYASDNRDARLKERCHRVPAGELEAIVLAQLGKRLGAESDLVSPTSLQVMPLSKRRRLVSDHIGKIEVHADRVDFHFTEQTGTSQVATIAVQLIRRGKETRLALSPDDHTTGQRDPALIKLVVKAHIAREALAAAGEATVEETARRLGYSRDYFGVLLRISYLAPDIIATILDGRQPIQLNRQRLARATSLPIAWQEQREMLGFAG